MTSASRHHAEGEIEIAAPTAAVWEVLSDFCGGHMWASGVARCYALGPKERGLGAGRHCDIKGLGGVDEVVIEWEPERRLSYSVTPVGPFSPGTSRWRLEPAGAQSTRVTLRFDYDMRFGVFGALLHALVVRHRLEHAQPGVLAQLKRHVEKHAVGGAA